MSEGGGPIQNSIDIHDFKRLEEAVTSLVDRHRRATAEIVSLRSQLKERDGRGREQQREIDELNARRAASGKRLDQLIEELDRLDSELERSRDGAA